jgi:hypothetical protein
MPPRSMTPPQSFAVQPPPHPLPGPHGGFARPASAPPDPERRPASLAPLVAAPPAYEPPAPFEPSFELVKPRKRRGALWLVLGAAAAVGLFAARPWLMQQVAAATGAAADTATENAEPAPTTPLVTTSATVPVSNSDAASVAGSASAAPAIGIASTPPVPTNAGRAHAEEEHLVIHDTVEPSLRELAHPTPAATPVAPAPTPPPAAAPPPAPPSPPPAAKPKEVPVSDADRYGI